MTTVVNEVSVRLLDPKPGATLTERQSQRAECMRLALSLVAGRGADILTVERIAHWLYGDEQ